MLRQLSWTLGLNVLTCIFFAEIKAHSSLPCVDDVMRVQAAAGADGALAVRRPTKTVGQNQ